MDPKKFKAIISWQDPESIYRSKIIFRILQLLQKIYYKVVRQNRTIYKDDKKE